MKKRFIMLGIVCLFMTGCQTAQKTIPEITTIAPADSAHEETETNKEERAEYLKIFYLEQNLNFEKEIKGSVYKVNTYFNKNSEHTILTRFFEIFQK